MMNDQETERTQKMENAASLGLHTFTVIPVQVTNDGFKQSAADMRMSTNPPDTEHQADQ